MFFWLCWGPVGFGSVMRSGPTGFGSVMLSGPTGLGHCLPLSPTLFVSVVGFSIRSSWFCDWLQTQEAFVQGWPSGPTGLVSVIALRCATITPDRVWFCVAFRSNKLWLCVFSIRHSRPWFCDCLQTQEVIVSWSPSKPVCFSLLLVHKNLVLWLPSGPTGFSSVIPLGWTGLLIAFKAKKCFWFLGWV